MYNSKLIFEQNPKNRLPINILLLTLSKMFVVKMTIVAIANGYLIQ